MKSVKELDVDIFKLFDDGWGVVTAGTPDNYNAMTISWGSLGSLWAPRNNAKQVATVYINPSRHTFDYIEKSEYYTISFFPEEYRKDVLYLGSHSGRDGDKLAETSLTPKTLSHDTIGYEEASLTMVCRKLYSDGFKKENMTEDMQEFYAKITEPHHFYIGEILEVIDNRGE